jgi:hypothetical protein
MKINAIVHQSSVSNVCAIPSVKIQIVIFTVWWRFFFALKWNEPHLERLWINYKSIVYLFIYLCITSKAEKQGVVSRSDVSQIDTNLPLCFITTSFCYNSLKAKKGPEAIAGKEEGHWRRKYGSKIIIPESLNLCILRFFLIYHSTLRKMQR